LHIFIDESGSFTPVTSRASVSVVGALIVPEHKLDLLFRKYSRMRERLPKEKGEVKGRLLREADVARVVDLLHKNTCIFEVVAIDLAVETTDGLNAHRLSQAEALTAHLTPEHHPELVGEVMELRRRLERMPLQLYVQSVVTIQLIGNIIRQVPAFWALRDLREILTYHWVIDGKAVGRITNAEDWWATTMLGLLQSRSRRDPMISPDWVDYSDFDAKFQRAIPDWLQPHMPYADHGIDLKLLLKESFRFSSEPEPGLELVDIVSNATRRALMDHLEKPGWSGVPRLMIHNSREQYVNLISLSGPSESRPRRPYEKVLAHGFRSGGRSLLTRSC
jgi:hypothetical protein